METIRLFSSNRYGVIAHIGVDDFIRAQIHRSVREYVYLAFAFSPVDISTNSAFVPNDIDVASNWIYPGLLLDT